MSVDVICFADRGRSPIHYLLKGFFAFGRLNVLEAAMGSGKSALCMTMAALLSDGRKFPCNSVHEPASSLMLTEEDDLEQDMIPRALAAHADQSKLFYVTEHWSFPEHLDKLEMFIADNDIKLVCIDPIEAHLTVSTRDSQNVRTVINQLKRVAERFNVCMILIRHLDVTGVRGLGPALGQVARSVVRIRADEDDSARRILSVHKNNMSAVTQEIGFYLRSNSNKDLVIEWEVAKSPPRRSPPDMTGVKFHNTSAWHLENE